MNVKRILFPVDLSDFSSSIVPQVILLAEKFGSEVHLVAVLDRQERFSNSYAPHSDLVADDKQEAAEHKLQQFEKESFIGFRNVKRNLLFGNPAQEILKYISSARIDLVIVATHRKKGLERALLDSVADEVIKKSLVPVMSINPAEEEFGWHVSQVSPDQELRLRPEWPDTGNERPV
jgi:nucleotide-binding universal stress UspA family protein